jgi:hypothetical protein
MKAKKTKHTQADWVAMGHWVEHVEHIYANTSLGAIGEALARHAITKAKGSAP